MRYPGDVDPSASPHRGPGFRAQRVWMYVAVDSGDSEGVVGVQTADGNWLPAVATDERRRDQLRPIVEGIARESGREIRLLCFSVREDLGVIKAGSVPPESPPGGADVE